MNISVFNIKLYYQLGYTLENFNILGEKSLLNIIEAVVSGKFVALNTFISRSYAQKVGNKRAAEMVSGERRSEPHLHSISGSH